MVNQIQMDRTINANTWDFSYYVHIKCSIECIFGEHYRMHNHDNVLAWPRNFNAPVSADGLNLQEKRVD